MEWWQGGRFRRCTQKTKVLQKQGRREEAARGASAAGRSQVWGQEPVVPTALEQWRDGMRKGGVGA